MTAPLQLFDALPAHIEDALRASIQRFGVLVPVVKDQHGRIVDGHHRSRIAVEVGVTYVTQTVTVADDDEAREIARTLNADRRHLTDEQRREVVAHLRGLGHSLRAIGAAVGIDKKQVQRDLEKIGDSVPNPERVIRQGGGSYPASRPRVEPDPDPVPTEALPLGQEYADEILERIDRQTAAPMTEPVWSTDELELRDRLGAGETVVVSYRPHHARIVAWAQHHGLLERIDRRSEWGNPFELPADGDRETVIRNYAEHYLPHKPSLLEHIGQLRGKALACWCAPDACHGDALKARAEP